MKVIDLLNKIANTKDYKDIPKKVKITTGTLKEEYRIWVWDGIWYIYEEDGEDVCICAEKLDLNDRVEVIEEAEKIEKLREPFLQEETLNYVKLLKSKINEIIDKVNKGE